MHKIDTSNTLKYNFPLIYLLSGVSRTAYEDEIRDAFLNSHYNLIKSRISIYPVISLYLNSALHDSEVTLINYTKKNISISLNEFSTNCFCDALTDVTHFRLPHKKRVFPVCLTFENISTFSISYINRNNKIIPVNKSKYLPRLSNYLFDQIIELEPGSVIIGILFWAKASSNKRYILLQIKGEKLTIEEFQRKAFLKLFDGKFIDLFDKYWIERRQGILFDYSDALEFIKSGINTELQSKTDYW